MYGAIRPALRASTRRPPARTISGRRYRYPSAPRIRSFHSTRSLADDATPPTGSGNRAVDSNGANKKSETAASESSEPSVATDDPDMLAQKLQRSREMARRYSSALRRSQRRNRAQDLPPVVVPDWFLQENVRTREDAQKSPTDSFERLGFTLSLQRRDTEDAARLSVPLGGPARGLSTLTQWLYAAWGSGLSNSQKRKIAHQLALQSGLGDSSPVVQALERGEDPATVRDQLRADLEARIKTVKQDIAEARKLIETSGNGRLAQMKDNFEHAELGLELSIQAYERLSSMEELREHEVPSLVIAEIRATVAACLSAPQSASHDTFPSTKTNLILHSPDNSMYKVLDGTVMSIARELGSDVVHLQAQDLAELAGDYLGEGPEPTPNSIRSLGYETYRLGFDMASDVAEFEREDTLAEDQDDPTPSPFPNFPMGPRRSFVQRVPISVIALTPALKALADSIKTSHNPTSENIASANEPQARLQSQGEIQLEDIKLANLLENLIDAPEMKRSRGNLKTGNPSVPPSPGNKAQKRSPPGFFDFSLTPAGDKVGIVTALPVKAVSKFDLAVGFGPLSKGTKLPPRSKIIYVSDIKELNGTQHGSRIIQKLEEIVRKQRNAGESVMIVGSTCNRDLTPDLSALGVQGLQSEGEEGFFRSIFVPVQSTRVSRELEVLPSTDTGSHANLHEHVSSKPEKAKFQAINLRHIQDMLRSLDPAVSQNISTREAGSADLRTAGSLIPGTYMRKVWTYDEVHRIVLATLGLHRLDSAGEELKWPHVALAMGLLKASDEVKYAITKRKAEQSRPRTSDEEWRKTSKQNESETDGGQFGAPSRRERERQLENVAMTATRHEKRLMPGIANPDQIKTTFDQVHVPAATVDSIRTLTSLSFIRPDAFNYGVLATEKISGALLYGPPGTGKTLLAKAVAKESGCAVLEVSGSQIMDKYIGEGEKNVTAVFSLARKLSPCIVFLDEADAVLSSRDVGRERSSHRDILNQFLKEWDGLNDLSVFVMVATNRPFDLDDAVIRRLPRRLLVDLPTQADRKEILRIHLRGEQLDAAVDLEDLAKRTPFYSGSDLKNVAVSAALACVKEENELAAIAAATATASESSQTSSTGIPQLVRGQAYSFPEKRILTTTHFDKALQEITASISEDMRSLNSIKKFDEKYGDKKGRKDKKGFGFGVAAEVNENAVRVRP